MTVCFFLCRYIFAVTVIGVVVALVVVVIFRLLIELLERINCLPKSDTPGALSE